MPVDVLEYYESPLGAVVTNDGNSQSPQSKRLFFIHAQIILGDGELSVKILVRPLA
jgi:hypothetical protein